MKRFTLTVGIFLMLMSCFVFGQESEVQVLYKLIATHSETVYTLGEGTTLGVKKGQKGNIYRPYYQTENGNVKADIVGEFEVVKASEFNSELNVSITGEHNNEFYAEFSVAPFNPNYTSVVSQLVSKGVVFTDGYQEVILNFDDRESAALSEYLRIMELSESAKVVADFMKEEMADIPIEAGCFTGRTMFDVMGNSTYEDVYSFLVYANEHWKLYFGNTWMFAEVYATWLTSEYAEKSSSLIKGKLSLGLALQRDFKYSNFPVIAELDPAYWGGIEDDIIKPSTLITHVNGVSMFNKTVAQVNSAIGSKENSKVEIKLFRAGVFETYTLPLLKTPSFSSQVQLEDLALESPNIYPVVKNEKWGFIDATGDYIVKPKYDEVQSLFFSFSNGLTKVELDGKVGFVNILGEEIIPPQYTECKSFSEGLAAIIEKEDESAFATEYLVGFIDVEGNRVLTMKYEIPSMYVGEYHGGFCEISEYRDGEFMKGYLDKKGELVIPMKYYKAEWFRNGMAIVSEGKESKNGTIDAKGNFVIPPTYDYINDFSQGQALAHINEHYYLIDENGKKLLDFKTYRPSTLGGYTKELFFIYSDKKVGLMNSKGEVLIKPKYDRLNGISTPLITVSEGEDHWFFINHSGEKVIEGPFQDALYFSEGVCWVKQNDLWGLIDTTGKWLIEPMSSVRPNAFSGPLSKIDTGDFMNPNYLYVNTSGRIIYNPK